MSNKRSKIVLSARSQSASPTRLLYPDRSCSVDNKPFTRFDHLSGFLLTLNSFLQSLLVIILPICDVFAQTNLRHLKQSQRLQRICIYTKIPRHRIDKYIGKTDSGLSDLDITLSELQTTLIESESLSHIARNSLTTTEHITELIQRLTRRRKSRSQ